MLRRDFLRTVAAGAAVPSLLGSMPLGARAGEVEQRYGDLLLRPRATDHLELVFTPSQPRPVRLLQLTDTHFHPGAAVNRINEKLFRKLIEDNQPDFIVHTGDFVNNDSKDKVEWTGLDIMNGLDKPWTLCFGNHDYPRHGAEGSKPLDEVRQGMENGFQGYVDAPTGRHYCYRYDVLKGDAKKPSACLFFFQVGYDEGDRRISDPQLAWFVQQMLHDAEREVDAPITVFVHIPLVEYDHLYEAGKATGEKGERVCFDSDTGESFRKFADSRRVVGVFCGHDHVNNFHGDWHGVDLVYGRVSGWGAYGPPTWKRGGRLITLDLDSPRPLPTHIEVFG